MGNSSHNSLENGQYIDKIHYYSDPAQPSHKVLHTNRLNEQLKTLQIDLQQGIDYVWIYKTPLSQKFITDFILNHQYLILKGEKYWWSLEKVDKVIILQSNPQKQKVIEWRGGYKRCSEGKWVPQSIDVNVIKCKVEDLVKILMNEYFAFVQYSVINKNCKDFADAINKALQKITVYRQSMIRS